MYTQYFRFEIRNPSNLTIPTDLSDFSVENVIKLYSFIKTAVFPTL